MKCPNKCPLWMACYLWAMLSMPFLYGMFGVFTLCLPAEAQTLTPASPPFDPVPAILALGIAAVVGGAGYWRHKNKAGFERAVDVARDVQHTVGEFAERSVHVVDGATGKLAALREKLEAEAKAAFPGGHEVLPGTHTTEQAMADEPNTDSTVDGVRVVNGSIIG